MQFDEQMKVIDVRMLLWSLTDLKGIPYPDESHTYTKWLVNDVLPRTDRDGANGGILLLEELNAAPKTVQAAAYQLTLDRRIGNYELPDGWIIIATGNREQDDGVYIKTPAPLMDRFELHEVRVDFETWINYATLAGYHPSVMAYLSFSQSSLYTFAEQDTDELKFATPRGWAAVSDLFDAELSDAETLRSKIEGNVGSIEGIKMVNYLERSKELPNLMKVLKGDYVKSGAVDMYKADLDVYHLLLQNLVYVVSEGYRAGRKVWQAYCDNSVDFITSVSNFPIELKKAYVDQLGGVSEEMKSYLYATSRSERLARLLQELEYVK